METLLQGWEKNFHLMSPMGYRRRKPVENGGGAEVLLLVDEKPHSRQEDNC